MEEEKPESDFEVVGWDWNLVGLVGSAVDWKPRWGRRRREWRNWDWERQPEGKNRSCRSTCGIFGGHDA